MSARLVKRVFVSMALVSILAGMTGNVSSANARMLELRLGTVKRSFARLEPVVLVYSVANPTSSVVSSRIRMNLETGGIKITVQDEQGQACDFYEGPIADTFMTQDVQHPPGDIQSESVRMFFNDMSDGLAFPRIGRHTIRARMFAGIESGEPTFLESNSVEIEVVPPAEVDMELLRDVGSEDRLIRLLRYGAGKHCVDQSAAVCFEELKSLVDRRRQSVYAPFIMYDLASAVGWGGLDVAPRYGLSEELLRAFLDRWPTHAFAPEVLGQLVYAVWNGGKRKDAVTLLDTFEKKYPDRRSVARQMRCKIDDGE